MARLSLTLLGGFQARLEPGSAIALPTRKSQALLAYLALPPGRAHPRDKLAALLWGGIREESARASLRQALFAIRKALSDTSAVWQDGDALALEPGAVEIDAAAFERLVREGTPAALERAAALYQGDLLSGFAVDEAPFEEWLLGERERLRELALEALAKLLAHQRKVGASEAAVQTALRLMTLDPLQEPVHRMLMRLYAEGGRRGAALRQYQQCVSVLGRELGIEPEPETKALYQEILRERPQHRAAVAEDRAPRVERAPGTGTETTLIGRADELTLLRNALAGAASSPSSPPTPPGAASRCCSDARTSRSRSCRSAPGSTRCGRGASPPTRTCSSVSVPPCVPSLRDCCPRSVPPPRSVERPMSAGYSRAWRR